MEFLEFFLMLSFFMSVVLALSGMFALLAALLTPRYVNAGEMLGGTAAFFYAMFQVFAHISAIVIIGRFIWISF